MFGSTWFQVLTVKYFQVFGSIWFVVRVLEWFQVIVPVWFQHLLPIQLLQYLQMYVHDFVDPLFMLLALQKPVLHYFPFYKFEFIPKTRLKSIIQKMFANKNGHEHSAHFKYYKQKMGDHKFSFKTLHFTLL